MSFSSKVLLLSCVIVLSYCTQYTLVVPEKSDYCIGEYLSEGTVGNN